VGKDKLICDNALWTLWGNQFVLVCATIVNMNLLPRRVSNREQVLRLRLLLFSFVPLATPPHKDIITMTTLLCDLPLMELWDVGPIEFSGAQFRTLAQFLRTVLVTTDAFRATCHRYQPPCKEICYGVLGIPCRTQLAILPESPHQTFSYSK
jgi:hypothetical protein